MRLEDSVAPKKEFPNASSICDELENLVLRSRFFIFSDIVFNSIFKQKLQGFEGIWRLGGIILCSVEKPFYQKLCYKKSVIILKMIHFV